MTGSLPCPHCEDGTQWRSRYGGNDPDVWAVTCEECSGTGFSRCSHINNRNGSRLCCIEDAVQDTPDGPMCAEHALQYVEEED